MKTISNMATRHLTGSVERWPIFSACIGYTMNIFVSVTNRGILPFKILFPKKLPSLTRKKFLPIEKVAKSCKEYMALLHDKFKFMTQLI